MADVIPLALWRRYRARSCPFPQTNAEILFFTGVRYERATELGARVTQPRSRRPATGKPVARRKARQPA